MTKRIFIALITLGPFAKIFGKSKSSKNLPDYNGGEFRKLLKTLNLFILSCNDGTPNAKLWAAFCEEGRTFFKDE